MPTGYTGDIYEGKCSSLKEYALTCARAFGALISMRDEPFNAEIPMRFEPDTSYYDDQIEEAKMDIEFINNASTSQLEEIVDNLNRDAMKLNQERIDKNNAMRDRYESMIAKVENWSGPEGLKEFMLQQLHSSLEFDVRDKVWQENASMTVDSYITETIDYAERQIERATQSRDEEIARCNDRNEWLAQLHKSLENVD